MDLSAVLEAVAAALRPTAEDNGNAIEIDRHLPDGRRAVIQGDRDQLMQVFLNLAENALKYGGPGRPVTLRLVAEEGSGSMKGPVLRVDVIDRGEGIEARHIPRLTERFYRIDTHRSREMGGTGLGLAIVKHIVNRHRGRLRVSSVTGQGSTFSAVFPAV
ncbi:ATP-binding protein [Roseicyclus elongatus]|uniref:ATP-binding protein n=1 Tax=Roseicyclus elongatus TaxID=159346 RepID=UPI0004B0BED6|nr:ATP-binding protein [Roseibacterium elongatum]